MRPESKYNKLKYQSMSLFLPTLFDTYISEKKITKKTVESSKINIIVESKETNYLKTRAE